MFFLGMGVGEVSKEKTKNAMGLIYIVLQMSMI